MGIKLWNSLVKAPHDNLDEFAADEPKSYLMGWPQTVNGGANRGRRLGGYDSFGGEA
jgi:hypothetical protein